MMLYLIQRGSIQNPPVYKHLSAAVDLDTMGRAEFEYGAQPRSLRAMHAAAVRRKLRFVRFLNIARADGSHLLGYGDFDKPGAPQCAAALQGIIDGNWHTLEGTNLPEAMRPVKFPHYVKTDADRAWYLASRTTFWWDLELNLMFSFDPKFMERLPSVLCQSWTLMNERADQDHPAMEPVIQTASLATARKVLTPVATL